MVVPNVSNKEYLNNLIDKKVEIERKISEHGQVLIANQSVGMQEELLDEQGFPRNDIDIYQVRHARHAIICLQNDLNQLLKQIEEGLYTFHSEARANCDASTKMANMDIDDSDHESQSSGISTAAVAIIKVNLVSPGSPAETAGIRENDEIIEFGSINGNNFKDLTQIGEIVKHKLNQQVTVKVRRNNRIHDIILVPKTWAGRGLLGCNVVLTNTN